MMFVAFSNLVFTFIIFPLGALLDTSDLSTFLALLLQVFYFAWSLNGFVELNTSAQRTKSFFVAFLAILLWSVFTIAGMAIYIYQSWDFFQFFTRMG